MPIEAAVEDAEETGDQTYVSSDEKTSGAVLRIGFLVHIVYFKLKLDHYNIS